jgi:hypothetical protein
VLDPTSSRGWSGASPATTRWTHFTPREREVLEPKTRTTSLSSIKPVDLVSKCMTRRSRPGAPESRGRRGEWWRGLP